MQGSKETGETRENKGGVRWARGVVWVLEGAGDDDLHTPLRVANWFLWTGLGSASVPVGLMAEE